VALWVGLAQTWGCFGNSKREGLNRPGESTLITDVYSPRVLKAMTTGSLHYYLLIYLNPSHLLGILFYRLRCSTVIILCLVILI
jgi:hypothetical protein